MGKFARTLSESEKRQFGDRGLCIRRLSRFSRKLSHDFFATHRVIVRTHGLLLIVSIHADYCKTSEKKAPIDVSVSPSLARSKIKNVAR